MLNLNPKCSLHICIHSFVSTELTDDIFTDIPTASSKRYKLNQERLEQEGSRRRTRREVRRCEERRGQERGIGGGKEGRQGKGRNFC